MLGPFDPVERRIGLQRNATDEWVQLFQSPGGADKSSRRTHDRNKVRDASFRLLPDLVGSGLVMRAPVGVVGILVRVEIKIGMLLCELVRDPRSAVGTFPGIGEDDICAV